MTDQESRFWAKVKKASPYSCWLWQGAKSSKGYHERRGSVPYGHMKWDGRTRYAHLISFMIHGGRIKKGTVIMHRCNNPLCVNPTHLERGTPEKNQQAIVAANRCCRNGSKRKLNKRQVLAIRNNPRRLSHSRLAEKYGTSKQNIEHIVARRTWRNI